MSFTDIQKQGWIEFLPQGIKPYVYLMRLDRPIGIWLLVLPGWWSIVLAAGGVRLMNAEDWFLFALFGLGAVVMRGAGCVVNDLWDRKLDQQVERTRLRPLAAGDLNVLQAIIFLVFLLVTGLGVLLQMNFITVF